MIGRLVDFRAQRLDEAFLVLPFVDAQDLWSIRVVVKQVSQESLPCLVDLCS